MRRIPRGLLIVLLIVLALNLYILIAKPVIVLPPVTYALPENNAFSSFQRLLKIDQLDITLRTNGRLTVAGNGQKFAHLSYTLDSLKNSADLAGRQVLPPIAIPIALGSLIVLFSLFPQLVWSIMLAVLSLYFIIPVEITFRIIRG